MEEKQLWSEIQKIIRRCERQQKKAARDQAASAPSEPDATETIAPPKKGARPSRRATPKDGPAQRPGSRKSHKPHEQRYEAFMKAIEEILRHDHEVNMDVTLRGDMARAFHITLAIGRHLWNLDEQSMVQRILQTGIENIIHEHNSEVALKEARKGFRPLLREILNELEDDETP